MNRYISYTGKGTQSIQIENPLRRGKSKFEVWSDNGNVEAIIAFPNGTEIRASYYTASPGQATQPGFTHIELEQDVPTARLNVSCNPSTNWKANVSLISAEGRTNHTSNQEARDSMVSQSPEYVCVNFSGPLNVRTGPGYGKFPTVAGGDKDSDGGAMPGIRYKVIRTVNDGELVSGNPIWHEIQFNNDSTGWVTEYYVDAC